MLAREQRERLFDELRRAQPHEACGYLSGRAGVALRVHPVRNIAGTPDVGRMSGQLQSDFPESTTGFVMDPRDQYRVLHAVDDAGEDVVAIYHTHPHSEPRPSPRDIRYASERHYALYVLLSEHTGTPELRAFVVRDDGGVDEVAVETREG